MSLKKSVKLNSPLPKNLAGECKKASKILNAFVDPVAAKGIDNIIPHDILARAKGLAIFTVIKAGFLWSGRMGTGIVVARLDDGTWSAPSAIGTGGVGFGGQIGAEITDFVMVLNNRAAVKSFTKGGNITLGGNLSVAAGPIGRNTEAGASATVGAIAAIYSYSKTKGLFAGVSIEGSIIVERKDTNEAFYRAPVTAAELLSGAIPPPPQADILYQALKMKASGGNRRYSGIEPGISYYGEANQGVSNVSPAHSPNIGGSASTAHPERFGNSQQETIGSGGGSSGGGYGSPSLGGGGRARPLTTGSGYAFNSPSSSNAGGYVGGADEKASRVNQASTALSPDLDEPAPSYTPTASGGSSIITAATNPVSKSSYKPAGGNPQGYGRPSNDNNNPFSASQNPMNSSIANNSSSSFRAVPPPPAMGAKPATVTALYDYKGEQPTDLSFRKGDRITVVKKTESLNDWWTGKLNGREGSFPANYVQ
ncbi:hypothetical protein BGX33_005676 [Mortierella sp. NVP41]|nr:hypothetical protein BGX33_005676 [Mortierella sp. NVP41]